MKEEVLTGCAILPSRLERIEDNKMDRSIKRKRIISIIIVAVLLAASVIVFLLVGKPLIQFVSDSDRLRAWVDENWLGSRLAYIGMVVFQIVVAIIPGEPFEIAAGYAFGAVEGTVICVLGSTIGGTLVFLLVKKFGVKLVEVFIPMEKIRSLKFLQDHKKRDIIPVILHTGDTKGCIELFCRADRYGCKDLAGDHYDRKASIYHNLHRRRKCNWDQTVSVCDSGVWHYDFDQRCRSWVL